MNFDYIERSSRLRDFVFVLAWLAPDDDADYNKQKN